VGTTGDAFCENHGELEPQCAPTEIWTRALKRGAKRDSLADLRLEGRTWSFTQPGQPVLDIPDDCKTPMPVARTTGKTTTPASVPPSVTTTVTTSNNPNTKIVVKPFDLDPKQLDLIAYIPKARAFARQVVPDVELSTVTFESVETDGLIDVAANQANASGISFVSKAGECWAVAVLFVGGHVTASAVRNPGDMCDRTPVAGPPHCTVSQVYARIPQARTGKFLIYSGRGWTDGDTSIPDDCK